MVAVNVFLNDQLLELEPLLVKEPRFELVHAHTIGAQLVVKGK